MMEIQISITLRDADGVLTVDSGFLKFPKGMKIGEACFIATQKAMTKLLDFIEPSKPKERRRD